MARRAYPHPGRAARRRRPPSSRAACPPIPALMLRFRLPAAAVALALLAPAAALAYPTSFGPVAHNPADALASLPIEAQRYDHAHRCVHHPRPGTVALQHWLERHARGISWGILRCERLSAHDYSLHVDGR